MKTIIDGKLYDTEKAKLVYGDGAGYGIYHTAKGAWFSGEFLTANTRIIKPIPESEVKNIIGRNNTELYVELFGEPEEA